MSRGEKSIVKTFKANLKATELYRVINNNMSIFKRNPCGDLLNCSEDRMLVMAYQLYLSGIVPKVVKNDNVHIDKVKADYDMTAGCAEARRSFIGGGWDRLALTASDVLAKDHRNVMATYGARMYKDLSFTEQGNFTPLLFKKQVSDIINKLIYLKEKYSSTSIDYKGFTDFYYPHFAFEGNIFNLGALADLEMSLFVRDIPFKVVAEIGGGDGHLCREIVKNYRAKYIIFDIPEMLTRSQLFLASYFPDRAVGGYSDFLESGKSMAKMLGKFDILCLPCWTANIIDCGIDLWVATHVLGEMPVEIAAKYMTIINGNSKFFVSISDNVDRYFKTLTISESSKYLKFLNMRLESADIPFTSCFPRIKPYYARYVYKNIR